jgi:hypothetical protein
MAKDAMTKTIVYVILAALVVLGWGIAFGGIREKVKANTTTAETVHLMAENNKNTISAIKEEQAYQKGVVNTKLDNLDAGQKQLLKIVSQWEPK